MLAVLSALLMMCPRARALDPAKSIFQYNCQNWTRPSGLPADRITSVAQTADGYIWLGSQNGLIRFDGAEFKVVPIDLAAVSFLGGTMKSKFNTEGSQISSAGS